MPRMDGMETLRRLRRTSAVSVIFLTSKNEEIDRNREKSHKGCGTSRGDAEACRRPQRSGQGNSTETVTERSIGHAFGSASLTAAAEEKQSIDAALGEVTLGHK